MTTLRNSHYPWTFLTSFDTLTLRWTWTSQRIGSSTTQRKIFLAPQSSYRTCLDYHSILDASSRRWHWMVFISPRARPRQFLACMHHAPSVMPCCLPTCSPNLVLDQQSGPSCDCDVLCHHPNLGWGCLRHGV